MEIEEIPVAGFERVARCRDDESGLNAFIAIHDTTLGAALGGVRMLPYESDAEALIDVLRLARGMTYKAAIAHTGQGGGKAVIICDPANKAEAIFVAMGRFIDAMEGQYLVAEDMNISVADLEIVHRETQWVTGLSVESGFSGNPSPLTAEGCLVGFRACLKEAFGTESLKGRRIAIHGIGAVGHLLAEMSLGEGAEVVVSDLDRERVQAFAKEKGAEWIEDPDDCLRCECDILSPCARGAILNAETIGALRCRIVAGAANNQLQEESDGDLLQERGILYAPDFVINAGGVINLAGERDEAGYDLGRVRKNVNRIGEALGEVFEISRTQEISTAAAADRLAEQILAAGSQGISRDSRDL